MRPIYTFLLSLGVISTISACKKDKATPKPAVSDIEFTMYDFRVSGDSAIEAINYPNSLILKNDYTWELDLARVKSNGTYAWTDIGNPLSEGQMANIKFTIIHWSDFISDLTLSNKLKAIFQNADFCPYSVQSPYIFCDIMDRSINADIRTRPK